MVDDGDTDASYIRCGRCGIKANKETAWRCNCGMTWESIVLANGDWEYRTGGTEGASG